MNPSTQLSSGVTVPFRPASSCAPLLLVDVRVNGQGPFQFVVDTGASGTGLSRRLAERLRLGDGEQRTALGAGGAVSAETVRVRELQVGPLRMENLPVFVTDLSAIAGKAGAEIDGILGYDFLHRWRVLIDYPGQTLTFSR
jgi:predicted aspartyl protease